MNSTVETSGWLAELNLVFGCAGSKTILASRRHQGPLQVQRPFYPEPDGTCHTYLLHPPGGVVGGDSLNINITVEKNAQVVITSPSAGKFYRSKGLSAKQCNHLIVAPHGSLEWFPMETIVFDEAKGKTTTRVELSLGGSFMGWEILCLGRPASGHNYNKGSFKQSLELWQDGKPLWIERADFQGGGPSMTSRWGMSGYPVTASFICVTSDMKLKGMIQDVIDAMRGEDLMSVTQLDQVLVCRYLGDHVERAKKFFISVWALLRPYVLKRSICAPRIWNT